MSGDVSLAANVTFPDDHASDPHRMVVLAIRSDLDDGSPEVVAKVDAAGAIRLMGRGVKKRAIHTIPANRSYAWSAFLRVHPHRNRKTRRPIHIEFQPSRRAAPPYRSLREPAPADPVPGWHWLLRTYLARALVSHVVLKNKSGKVR